MMGINRNGIGTTSLYYRVNRCSVFYIGHILSDFAWYTVISTAISKGKKLISDTVYSSIALLLGIFIIAFSFYFISSGWKMLSSSMM
ncbi:LysE family transporter [Acetivibrio straminisolvens]|uniref:LysE family transporter n=1 Tax=Acetivibrio straminisolvens TaxID=253314 RepID=UPI001FB0CEB0|nr:LysE family transporter [Acetivibrio straminisolvens]